MPKLSQGHRNGSRKARRHRRKPEQRRQQDASCHGGYQDAAPKNKRRGLAVVGAGWLVYTKRVLKTLQSPCGLCLSLWLAACPQTADKAPDADAVCTLRGQSNGTADGLLAGSGSCTQRLSFSLRVGTGSATAPTWADPAAAGLAVEGSWTAAGATATRSVRVHNTGTTAVDLVALEWALPWDSPLGHTMLHQGYQSWSYTGVEPVPAQVEMRNGTAVHGGDNGNELDEKPGVSWWMTWVSDPEGNALVLGATGGSVLKTYVAVERSLIRLIQGATGDALHLAPGATVELDGLFVALGPVNATADAYAAAVAELHPRPGAATPQMGWGSWNLYYDDIDATTLANETAWAADNLLPLGMPVLLLDDGYPPAWGQWTADLSFGATLESVAAQQRAVGLEPALWVAPLTADASAPVVTAHPEWFVATTTGAVLHQRLAGGRDVVHWDLTQPQAREHLLGQLQTLAQAGFGMLKIDFLFSGAVEGVRSQEVTALQHYHLALQAIRNALPGVHLLGCGAPLLPSAGMVDSMRTGPDIAFVVAREPTYAFVAGQARHTALRAFTDRWWVMDADVVLLRGASLTDNAAWTAVVSAAFSGGNWLLGDGQQAPPHRLAMAVAPQIRALVDGVAARAEQPQSQVDPDLLFSPLLDLNAAAAVPHVWRKPYANSTQAVAVFGWSDGFSAHVALPDGAQEVVPPTPTSALTLLMPPEGVVEVAPHAVRLFMVPMP